MVREYLLRPSRSPSEPQIDYQKELNEHQHAAVTAPPGPALVIAGAGAGKTRTLTYRVAYLLEQGIPPERILLLTFTNKAAAEMMGRVRDLVGRDLKALWGGTFHSIGQRILRRHADRLGYRRDFTILDRDDAHDLLNRCLSDLGIQPTGKGKGKGKAKDRGFPKAEVVGGIFSLATNSQKTPADVVGERYPDLEEHLPTLETLSQRYRERKQAAQSMDFDDLLALWWKLLREHPDVREEYQRRFQFVLVDEYQDTNRLQSDLIDLLAARHHNVMAVGDDSQSIYGWRGADFRNILSFPERFPKTEIYKIEINYRSRPEILSLANAVIARNPHQFPKQLTAYRESGPLPALITSYDAEEQARFVAQQACALQEEGVALSAMAVLYRSHFHALELQLELTRQGIPFVITSGIRFFEQAHIKDVVAYLKLITNPRDEVAFKRIVERLPGIGAKSADKLWGQVLKATADQGDSVDVAAGLRAVQSGVAKKAQDEWAQLAETVAQLGDPSVRDRPGRLIELILNAGYDDYLRVTYNNATARKDDLEQLAHYASQFETTEEFLGQLALLTNLEAENTGTASQETDQLRLLTIHQAKGLEFRAVFLIMLCEGLFPSFRSLERPENEEEERRLFYVALTRAQDRLYMIHPMLRYSRNYTGDPLQQPSRFVQEIPAELYEPWQLRDPYA